MCCAGRKKVSRQTGLGLGTANYELKKRRTFVGRNPAI
jgi:hypothetical protein